MCAAERNHPTVVKCLLNAGCCIDIRSDKVRHADSILSLSPLSLTRLSVVGRSVAGHDTDDVCGQGRPRRHADSDLAERGDAGPAGVCVCVV